MSYRTLLIENKILLSILFFQIISKTFCQVSSEGVPRLLDITDYKKIIFTSVNKTLELKCPIDESKRKTYVEWERENESLYMKPGYEITKRGTLKIKSVGVQHAGTYTCEAVNGYGFLQVTITVVIDRLEEKTLDDMSIKSNSINRIYVSPPRIEEGSVNFVDDVGDGATLHCVARGQPLPHIFWFKNGVQIKNAETEFSKGKVHSTLKLKNLQIHNFGTYKCLARNVVSEAHKNFDLQVKADFPNPPQILSLEPTESAIEEGEAAVFWCEIYIGMVQELNEEITSDSPVMDDATLFRFGANFYRPITLPNGMSTNPGPDGFYKSKLLIPNTCVADSGTYICLALNDKGFNFKNVTLTVTSTGLIKFYF
ncbi:fibroblast growth factor receptor-like 1 [Trichonephila clavata]|uniref:Fibroblast growth factor receptor-like 1 n=1 Tax=Trichonephila clavata TaxID=2740835 RepID=A0A8X6F660_TRICU|nr:fibroblast growth factor receptor-like 1 [Trichonephila clavata]